MSIILLNTGPSKVVAKQIEIVKINGKYYIELEDNIENSDVIIELSIALSQENDSLKEHIAILEEKISVLRSLK